MKKTRHHTSERLFAPRRRAEEKNARAIAFKHAILLSAKTERLNPDIATKSLGGTIGESASGQKQTYTDTDSRKREFGGDLPPGLEGEGGFVYEPNANGEDPDMVLRLFPSYMSVRTNELKQKPNFGWVKKNPDDASGELRKKPQIVLKKYKVNPKTDDIIQSSEKTINPFSMFSGEEFTDDSIPQPLNTKRLDRLIQTKKLPGRPLSARIPGGSLIGRAAAAIGIVRDAANKFRCPPGTPAANQFTDMYGTTCFGASPSRIARFIHDKAVEVTDAGEMAGFTRFARRFVNWTQTGGWDDDQGISNLPMNRAVKYLVPGARAPGFDPVTGRSVAPDWSEIDVPSDLRTFRNGLINAQKRLAQSKKTVSNLQKELGVDTSESARATNADLQQTFDELKDRGLWTVNLERMSPEQVEEMVRRRINDVEETLDFALTNEQRERLVKADIQRYYATERGILEANLEQFTRMPEHMKSVRRLTLQDGMDADDEGGSMMDGKGNSNIDFNMSIIMSNQEAKLPKLAFNERLLVTATGGGSDSERAAAVADFMARADLHANHMAGLAGGVEGMGRHIALHEIGHSIQTKQIYDAIAAEIAVNGRFVVQAFVHPNTGKKFNAREVTDIKKLTSTDLIGIMANIDKYMSDEQVEKLRNLKNVYGAYPEESYFSKGKNGIGILEAQTEIWALREGGFISGDDVDEALFSLDDHIGKLSDEARVKASERYIESIKPGTAKRDDTSVDVPESKMPDSEADLELAARRNALKELRTALRGGNDSEDDFFDVAIDIKLQSENAGIKIKNVADEIEMLRKEQSKFKPDSKNFKELDSKIDELKTRLAKHKIEKEFYDEAFNITRNEWKKKYGIGTRAETSRFNEMVYERRRAAGKLTVDEAQEALSEQKLEFFKKEAKKLSAKELIDELAALDVMKFDSEEELINADLKREALIDEYVERAIDKGDKRKRYQIKRELEKNIEERFTPKVKPKKTFKSSKDAKDHASSERKKLRKRITTEQAQAVKEMGDFVSKDIAEILKPEKNASAGRAMNRRNQRLQRLALESNPKSTSEGSMEQQVENILIPTLEAMDSSSVSEPFEFEAIIDVEPGTFTGRSVGKEHEHKNFIKGNVIGRNHKKAEVGKKQRRVIVSVKEGDRGLFPTAKGDDKQAFVIPPGKLTVIGRDPDGTIRVEISSQKGAIDVVDDLAKDLANGKGDAIWRKSASRKVKTIADKKIIEKPERLSSGRSGDSEEIRLSSKNIVKKAKEYGGSFGEYSKDRDEENDVVGKNFDIAKWISDPLNELNLLETELSMAKPENTPLAEQKMKRIKQLRKTVRESGRESLSMRAETIGKSPDKIFEEDRDMRRSLEELLLDPKSLLEMLEREESGPFRPGPITMTREERQRKIRKLRRELQREGRESSGMRQERIGEEASQKPQSIGKSPDKIFEEDKRLRRELEQILEGVGPLPAAPSKQYTEPITGQPEPIRAIGKSPDKIIEEDKRLRRELEQILERVGPLPAVPSKKYTEPITGRPEPIMAKPRNVFEALKNPIDDGFDIDRDDIDEKVVELIDSKSSEELEDIVERVAIKFHIGLDKKPRVRMRESELDEFSETGKIRATRTTGSSVVRGTSRRAERLSSGRQRPLNRKDREADFVVQVKEKIKDKLARIPEVDTSGMNKQDAEKAIRDNIDNWINGLNDIELSILGISRAKDKNGEIRRSKLTKKIIYQTDNPEIAASLLSLGQTVEMPELNSESKMVQEVAKQIQKELKDLKDKGVDVINMCAFYIDGKNLFCNSSLDIERKNMPQVAGRAINNDSLAMRMWASQLAEADVASAHMFHENSAKLKELKDRAKKMPAGKEKEQLDKDIKILEEIVGVGFEPAGIEQKDLANPEKKFEIKKVEYTAKEIKETMDRHGVTITARELKRLGEKWNRIVVAMRAGQEPDPADVFTDEEKANFFSHLDYSLVEVDGLDPFTDFLKKQGVKFKDDELVKPENLMASQNELVAPQMAGIAGNITGAIKALRDIKDPIERQKEIDRLRRESGLFKKILISNEGYILDGHHRIMGKVVSNGVIAEDFGDISIDDLEMLGLPVRRAEMGIIELLTISKIYQDRLGIKPASLKASEDESYTPDKFGIDKIPKITKEEVDAIHNELGTSGDAAGDGGLIEKMDEIYEKGTFLRVDSIGLNNTSESILYKESEIKRRNEASARQEARRARRPEGVKTQTQETERLSSGRRAVQEQINETRKQLKKLNTPQDNET